MHKAPRGYRAAAAAAVKKSSYRCCASAGATRRFCIWTILKGWRDDLFFWRFWGNYVSTLGFYNPEVVTKRTLFWAILQGLRDNLTGWLTLSDASRPAQQYQLRHRKNRHCRQCRWAWCRGTSRDHRRNDRHINANLGLGPSPALVTYATMLKVKRKPSLTEKPHVGGTLDLRP